MFRFPYFKSSKIFVVQLETLQGRSNGSTTELLFGFLLSQFLSSLRKQRMHIRLGPEPTRFVRFRTPGHDP